MDTKKENKKIECDFAAEWKVDEEKFKSVESFGFLDSKKLPTMIPDLQYYFRVFPNGCQISGEETLSVWLCLDTPIKKVKGKCVAVLPISNEKRLVTFDFTPDSKKIRLLFHLNRESNPAQQNIFRNGTASFKFTGSFECDSLKRSSTGYDPIERKFFGQNRWDDDESKDFTIYVDEKKIKAHKNLLRSNSLFFAQMFDAEAPQESIIIEGYEYETVEIAVKHCYDFDVGPLDEKKIVELIKFADMYAFHPLMEEVGYSATDKLNKENLCQIANASKKYNADTLKSSCMNSFLKTLGSPGNGPNLKLLDAKLKSELFAHLFFKSR